MKKITAMILSVFMIMATSTVVFAESTPYYQATQMTYEVPSSFTAMIPMEMNAGESVSISVTDVNLADGSKILATICYLDEDDEIKLRNNDESDQISVKVYDKNGNQYTRGNNFVGVFADNNQSYSVRTEVQYANDAKAGLYTGYMCFEFEIVAS